MLVGRWSVEIFKRDRKFQSRSFYLRAPRGVQRRAWSKISIHDRSLKIFNPKGRDRFFSIPGPSGTEKHTTSTPKTHQKQTRAKTTFLLPRKKKKNLVKIFDIINGEISVSLWEVEFRRSQNGCACSWESPVQDPWNWIKALPYKYPI